MDTVTAATLTQQAPDGMPIDGQDAFPHLVAADAIAALSRTNLRSVVRVLTAIDILKRRLHVSTDAIVDIDRAPTETPKAHQNEEALFEALPLAKRRRILAADALLDDVELDPGMSMHLDMLNRR